MKLRLSRMQRAAPQLAGHVVGVQRVHDAVGDQRRDDKDEWLVPSPNKLSGPLSRSKGTGASMQQATTTDKLIEAFRKCLTQFKQIASYFSKPRDSQGHDHRTKAASGFAPRLGIQESGGRVTREQVHDAAVAAFEVEIAPTLEGFENGSIDFIKVQCCRAFTMGVRFGMEYSKHGGRGLQAPASISISLK